MKKHELLPLPPPHPPKYSQSGASKPGILCLVPITCVPRNEEYVKKTIRHRKK